MDTRTYEIAKKACFAEPKAVGWGSNGKPPMSHDKALTESQFLNLLHSGVLRDDDEVAAYDAWERKQ